MQEIDDLKSALKSFIRAATSTTYHSQRSPFPVGYSQAEKKLDKAFKNLSEAMDKKKEQ